MGKLPPTNEISATNYQIIQNGAKTLSVTPFDMYCHTLHIENVAIVNN